MRSKLLFLLIALPAVFLAHFTPLFAQAQGENAKHLKVTLTFDGVPTNVDIQKAKLKYNKDFAYSFTLDDGIDNAYTVAFSLLNGGYIKETDSTYAGLFYTDGCGNNIPFKGGLAWFSVNRNKSDLHVNTPGYMTWEQLKQMHDAGWGVFNHSYSHAANGDDIDFNYQVVSNTEHIERKTGIKTQHFVVPAGDIRYVEPAFNNKMVAVYDQASSFPGAGGLRIDTLISLNQFKLRRKFLEDKQHNTSNITNWINEVANKSTGAEKYWYNDFTHGIIFQQTGGSLKFSTFEYYMNYIYNTYGKGGKDNIWVASLQEVYEYLAVRDKAAVSTAVNGNKVDLVIDLKDIPDSLRHYALSLTVNADKDLSAVEVTGNPQVTFKGTGDNKLINLQWDSSLVLTSASHYNINNRELLSFQAYPNPIGEEGVNIVANNLRPNEKMTVNFFDQLGRRVHSVALYADSNGKIAANIPAGRVLKKGLYILAASTQSQTAHSKIVVE